MGLLSTLKKLVNDGTEVTLKVSRNNDGLRVIVLPKVGALKPDTTDEGTARLQAALAQPLVFDLQGDADPDEELLGLLDQATAQRQTTAERLVSYQEAQLQAQQAATAAAAAAAAASKAAKAGKAGKPAAKGSDVSSDDANAATSLTPEPGAAQAATPVAPPTQPQSLNLFGEDEA